MWLFVDNTFLSVFCRSLSLTALTRASVFPISICSKAPYLWAWWGLFAVACSGRTCVQQQLHASMLQTADMRHQACYGLPPTWTEGSPAVPSTGPPGVRLLWSKAETMPEFCRVWLKGWRCTGDILWGTDTKGAYHFGGIVFGSATDGERIYTSNANQGTEVRAIPCKGPVFYKRGSVSKW